jgi:hypothetical protein
MISLFCIILTLGLSSCGIFSKHKEKDPSNDARISSLVKKYQTMAAEYRDVSKDQNGWPDVNDCDATLWAGETCAAGLGVQILDAEYPLAGQIQRRPSESCYTNGQSNGSSSSVSNDMLLGYLYCLWRTKDVHALQRLADYGEAHNWQMGEPQTSDRVFLKPNQQGILGRALKVLGGGDKDYAAIPPVYFPVKADFEKHLEALGILLNGEIDGSINGSMYDLLKDMSDSSDAPLKAAYGKYSGDQGPALDLLLDGAYEYPSYVRPVENYKMVHWLFSASVVLGGIPVDE